MPVLSAHVFTSIHSFSDAFLPGAASYYKNTSTWKATNHQLFHPGWPVLVYADNSSGQDAQKRMLAQIEVQDTFLLVFNCFAKDSFSVISRPKFLFAENTTVQWMKTCYLLYTHSLQQSKSRTTQVGSSHVADKTFPIFHIPVGRAHNSHVKIRNNLGHNGSRITFPKISCNSDNLDSSLVCIHTTRYTSASFYIKIPGLPILWRYFLQFTSMPQPK